MLCYTMTLSDLKGILQPKQIYDYMMRFCDLQIVQQFKVFKCLFQGREEETRKQVH